MANDLNLITIFSAAFKSNKQGAIIALLALGNVFFATKWGFAEKATNACYQESIQQERKNTQERQATYELISRQSYTIGELKAKIELKK